MLGCHICARFEAPSCLDIAGSRCRADELMVMCVSTALMVLVYRQPCYLLRTAITTAGVPGTCCTCGWVFVAAAVV